ncbi:unnamed protein product [Chrysoparadoxa australica]
MAHSHGAMASTWDGSVATLGVVQPPPSYKTCIAQNCSSQAHYLATDPRDGIEKVAYCVLHKDMAQGTVTQIAAVTAAAPGQTDHLVQQRKRVTCATLGCDKIPHYGYPGHQGTGSVRMKYCAVHKSENMVLLGKGKECAAPGCTKQPGFGFEGKGRTRCIAHKEEGMTYLAKRQACQVPDCARRATFGYMGAGITSCGQHKQPAMFNWNGKCSRDKCTRAVKFGPPGAIKPTVCAFHQSDETPVDFKAPGGERGKKWQKRKMAAQARPHKNWPPGMGPMGHTGSQVQSQGQPLVPPPVYAPHSSHPAHTTQGMPLYSQAPPMSSMGGHHLPYQPHQQLHASHPHSQIGIGARPPAVLQAMGTAPSVGSLASAPNPGLIPGLSGPPGGLGTPISQPHQQSHAPPHQPVVNPLFTASNPHHGLVPGLTIPTSAPAPAPAPRASVTSEPIRSMPHDQSTVPARKLQVEVPDPDEEEEDGADGKVQAKVSARGRNIKAKRPYSPDHAARPRSTKARTGPGPFEDDQQQQEEEDGDKGGADVADGAVDEKLNGQASTDAAADPPQDKGQDGGQSARGGARGRARTRGATRGRGGRGRAPGSGGPYYNRNYDGESAGPDGPDGEPANCCIC